ncbi:MAG TPA: hypothetical protein VFS27_07550 [Blastocatellia bacterium]|jgi:hypothetical protein|nr:hypothetical protein [Blastocatellia bacterium]
MIRHVNCGLTPAIISLPIAMVEASFRTLLVSSASCAQLLSE